MKFGRNIIIGLIA